MFSPASERNKEPIRQILANKLSNTTVKQLLELACGSLQHACHIAPALPDLTWQPSDINPAALEHGQTIERPDNVLTPIYLDVTGEHWPLWQADAIYTANLLHISPPEVMAGLFHGASRLGVSHVFIYGPFSIDGQHTSEGNLKFDAELKRRDPSWGIRDLDTVIRAAERSGYKLFDSTRMPANNLFLHFTSADQGDHE